MSTSHIPGSVLDILRSEFRQRVEPGDVEAFEEVMFVDATVGRKFTMARDEKPKKVKAFVAFRTGEDSLVWACDTHQPIMGRRYTVYTLRSLLRLGRGGRRHREIPVVVDTSVLGQEEERLSENDTLHVRSTLTAVEVEKDGGKKNYTLKLGLSFEGRMVRAKDGFEPPLDKKTEFVVVPHRLEWHEAVALWTEKVEESDEPLTDPFLVRITLGSRKSIFDWTARLGLNDRDLARITEAGLQAIDDRRTTKLREAYTRAANDLRVINLGKDDKAEAAMKAERFPHLVILEGCLAAAKAWIGKRDAVKAAEVAEAEAARKAKAEAAKTAPVAEAAGKGNGAAEAADDKGEKAKPKQGKPRRRTSRKSKGADASKDAE